MKDIKPYDISFLIFFLAFMGGVYYIYDLGTTLLVGGAVGMIISLMVSRNA